MRAAILLLPFAAFAGIWSAGALQADPQGDNAMVAARAANDSMDMTMMNAAAEAEMTFTNSTAPENDAMLSANQVDSMDIYANAVAEPAWLRDASWSYATQAEGGAVWYFDLDFDRTARPLRLRLRTDETPDSARTTNNSERLAELDCAGRRYRILRTVHRDDAGRASEADERGDGRLVPIVPGSVLAGVADQVCAFAEQPASDAGNAM